MVIYVDTSAFIKLYIREDGSEALNSYLLSRNEPLPLWYLHETEFLNALRFKVFLKELKNDAVTKIFELYQSRRKQGIYYQPLLDPVALREKAMALTEHTPELGCRSLDILHVAAALCLQSDIFITFD